MVCAHEVGVTQTFGTSNKTRVLMDTPTAGSMVHAWAGSGWGWDRQVEQGTSTSEATMPGYHSPTIRRTCFITVAMASWLLLQAVCHHTEEKTTTVRTYKTRLDHTTRHQRARTHNTLGGITTLALCQYNKHGRIPNTGRRGRGRLCGGDQHSAHRVTGIWGCKVEHSSMLPCLNASTIHLAAVHKQPANKGCGNVVHLHTCSHHHTAFTVCLCGPLVCCVWVR